MHNFGEKLFGKVHAASQLPELYRMFSVMSLFIIWNLICGRRLDLVQLWAVSAERLSVVADTARRLPVRGQRVYVGQPWACLLWQQRGHCAVQQDRDWSGQREPAWREAPLTRQHRYFLICPLKHFDIIRPHRATSTLITLTFGSAAKWAKRGKRGRNRQKHRADIRSWCMSEMLDGHLMGTVPFTSGACESHATRQHFCLP